MRLEEHNMESGLYGYNRWVWTAWCYEAPCAGLFCFFFNGDVQDFFGGQAKLRLWDFDWLKGKDGFFEWL